MAFAETFFLHLPPDHGQRAQNQAQEAEAGGHLVRSQAEIDDPAEQQHSREHTRHQRGKKPQIVPQIFQEASQRLQGLSVQAENNQQHAAAESRGHAADAYDDAF